MADRRTIPLFPLPNVVHFPQTNLLLHVFEPRYRRLVEDLGSLAEDERLIGIVLMQTDWRGSPTTPSPIYQPGTASLLVNVEPLTDGRSNIVLEGQFRFRIERELPARPYRRAVVQALDELPIRTPDELASLHAELLSVARLLAATTRGLSELADEDLEGLTFEQLVNGLAASIDLPIRAKLELLGSDLQSRASRLLSILRHRRRVVDLLVPFRGLDAHPERN